jgi:hypothetical protein
MRAFTLALTMASALFIAVPAFGHGPQLQITRDNDKITTRHMIREEPYSTSLTRPISAYVIPMLETGGVWYSRPNNTPSATLPGQPEYLSGPGIAFGYDQVDGGTRDFASGQRFELNLIDGLEWWNGAAFVDPGLEEIQAFRSSGSAVTNDSLTPVSPATMPYGNVSATYNAGAHSSASFQLLGDGTSPTAASDDGVYLLSMTYGSSEAGLNDSDPFYFVLHKNAPAADVAAAVGSLGLAPSRVQYVPEPCAAVLLAAGGAWLTVGRASRHLRRSRR